MREGGSKNYDGKRFPTVLGCLGLRAVFPGCRTFRTKNEKALGRQGKMATLAGRLRPIKH